MKNHTVKLYPHLKNACTVKHLESRKSSVKQNCEQSEHSSRQVELHISSFVKLIISILPKEGNANLDEIRMKKVNKSADFVICFIINIFHTHITPGGAQGTIWYAEKLLHQ